MWWLFWVGSLLLDAALVFFVVHLVLGTGLDYLARIYLNLGSPGT